MVALISADPSENNAGFRQRIRILYGVGDADVEVLSCKDMLDKNVVAGCLKKHDLFVLIKPFDEFYWAIAQFLTVMGKKYICDVFDNYLTRHIDISQRGMPKFQADVFEHAAMIVTSTKFLRSCVQKAVTAPEKVVTISDPLSPTYQTDWHGTRRKWLEAAAERRLNVLWFGISSNPYFASGLVDITKIMSDLAKITGYDIRITVCTNINEDIKLLTDLYKHPFPITVEEWSLETQEKCLREAHIVTLPTNTSSFVLSKTHNRYSTAVQAGCLVLHTGHPEYQGTVEEVVSLLDDPCPMNGYNVVEYIRAANADLERRYHWDRLRWRIDGVLARAQSTPAQAVPSGGQLCILWTPGPKSSDCHKLLTNNGHISAGLKQAGRSLNYHIFFASTEDGDLAILVDPKKRSILARSKGLSEGANGELIVCHEEFGLSKAQIRFRALQIRTEMYSQSLFDDLSVILKQVLASNVSVVSGFCFAASDEYALSRSSI